MTEEKNRRKDEVGGMKEEAGSRDKVKHIESSDQLFVRNLMQVDERGLQEMKCECCGEVEHCEQ